MKVTLTQKKKRKNRLIPHAHKFSKKHNNIQGQMEYISLLVLLIAVISNPSLAQPQGQTCVASATLGQTAASGCTVGSNQQCGSAGANNYISCKYFRDIISLKAN